MPAAARNRHAPHAAPEGDKVRAPNDLRLHPAIMPHVSFRREADDRLSDLARTRRSRCHRRIGGVLVSTDIIQIIPRPKHDDAQTDFPAIAFRSARQDPVTDPVDAAPDKHAGPAGREA
jgi:hypothetical protein